MSGSDSDGDLPRQPRHPLPPQPETPARGVRVTALFIYPVKGCGGIALNSATLGLHGFEYDRHWLVVRASTHGFVTQRQFPRMCLIGAPAPVRVRSRSRAGLMTRTWRSVRSNCPLSRPPPVTSIDAAAGLLRLTAPGQPELAVYSATKFGVRGLTEALELEWRRHGIRVIAMWPLFVQTAMVDGMETGSTKSLGIHLTADDVAEAIYSATHPGREWLPKVHYPVGTQTKLLASLSQVSPNWVQRLMNKTVSKS